jgi:hypothetical protein
MMVDTGDFTLTHEDFQARLEDLGLKIGLSTLKRWAYEGVIERPQRYKKGKGGRRGRAVKWSSHAIEETCAVWAIRNNPITKGFASKKRIEEVKRAVSRVYQHPTAEYKLRTSSRSPAPKEDEEDSLPNIVAGLSIDEVTMKLVGDDVLHNLMTTWIAATEKARNGWPVSQTAKVIFHWYGVHYRFGKPPVYDLRDRSQMPWDHDVIDDIYEYRLERVTLEEATRDEVIYFIDGEDSRTRDLLIK